jgi:hypothetical protein
MRRFPIPAFAMILALACGSSAGSGGGDNGVPDNSPVELAYDSPGDDVPAVDGVDDAAVADTPDGVAGDVIAATKRVEFTVDTSLPIPVAAKQIYTIRARVVDSSTGEPMKNVAVSFKIIIVTDGVGGEEVLEYGVPLTSTSSITDGSGLASVPFQAGETIGLLFTIEASAKEAQPARMDLVVANLDCAKLKVSATYSGSLSEAASFVVSMLPADTKCADLQAGKLPSPIAEGVGTDFAVAVELPCLTPDTTFTVFVTGKEACPFAAGCTENVKTPGKDATGEVAVWLDGVDVTLNGQFTGAHKFVLTDLFPDCAGLVTAQECAAPGSLAFAKLGCCYLDSIEGFFKSDAPAIAGKIKADAVSWSGGKVPSGKEAAFETAVDAAVAEYLTANTPAWVATFQTMGKAVQQAVRQVSVTSNMVVDPAGVDGDYSTSVAWDAYTIYWKVGCDQADPNYFMCGKCTYAMSRFGGLAYSPAIPNSSFKLTRAAGNLFDVSQHDVGLNPGKLMVYVANEVGTNALTGGTIRDGIFKDGLAKNVGEAAALWIDCAAVAGVLIGKTGTAFVGTQADLQGLCSGALKKMLASNEALQAAVTTSSLLKVSGQAAWTDTNCDMGADRFQEGKYTGEFKPGSGSSVVIGGSFSAARK